MDEQPEENIISTSSSQKETIDIIYKLFNIPPSTPDSFKNKELKLKFRNDPNIKFGENFTVKYTGKGVSKIDYGIIQTEKEISNKRPVFYFEVTIINDGKEADLLIGIGEKDIVEKCIQLGLTTHSYGYYAKGKSFNNKKSDKYGETYKTGDIIGCGVDFLNKSIFYTKNGKFLDYAFKDVIIELNKGFFYPSVCLHSLNEEVKFNFGIEDFKYDINDYYNSVLLNKYNLLKGYNPTYDEMDYLVKEYLFHESYMNTFKIMVLKRNENIDNKNLCFKSNEYNCITMNDNKNDIENIIMDVIK
mgnify:FL=1